MLDYFRYRLVGELNTPKLQRALAKSQKERRGLVSIGVIDDSPFEPKKNLENVGYRVTLLGDPSNVDAVVPHNIVLCDVQGVGHSLDSKKQGAFLIREIKAHFPDKYVIAYTGGSMNQTLTREAIQNSDAFLKKDEIIEEWTEKLDDVISKLLNPYHVWQRQRMVLVAKEVDTKTLLKLEDAYVRSIEAGSKAEHSPLGKLLEFGAVKQDARAVIQGIISSGLYALLAG